MLQDLPAVVLEGSATASPPGVCTGAPPVDTYRSEHGLTLILDLPDMQPESIRVSAAANVLQVSGRRRGTQPQGDQSPPPALVVRRLFLAEEIPAGAVRSRYDGWVLRLMIDELGAGAPTESKAGSSG